MSLSHPPFLDSHYTSPREILPSPHLLQPTGDIDHEDVDKHIYWVTAQDGSGTKLTVSYTIEVEDENDSSPTFQYGSYYTFIIKEDHTVSGLSVAISSTVYDVSV